MALVTKNFTLNVTPGAMPPTVHVSEYDIGRIYTVQLLDENGSAYEIPTGTTATVEGTLNGTVGFTTSATISNNQITFALTESMTAYAGKAWCKIKLTLNDEPIQTCAFVLAVDRAGVEADTVIGADGFETQIQNAVDNYLDEHPVVEVDPTLSISGAAADAKVTGDKIDKVENSFENLAAATATAKLTGSYFDFSPYIGKNLVGTGGMFPAANTTFDIDVSGLDLAGKRLTTGLFVSEGVSPIEGYITESQLDANGNQIYPTSGYHYVNHVMQILEGCNTIRLYCSPQGYTAYQNAILNHAQLYTTTAEQVDYTVSYTPLNQDEIDEASVILADISKPAYLGSYFDFSPYIGKKLIGAGCMFPAANTAFDIDVSGLDLPGKRITTYLWLSDSPDFKMGYITETQLDADGNQISPSSGYHYIGSPATILPNCKTIRLFATQNALTYWGNLTVEHAQLYESGSEQVDFEKVYVPKTINAWQGKKWVSYGDSITAMGLWQPYVVNAIGLTLVNAGLGGSSVADGNDQSIASFTDTTRISALPSDADIVTIMGGTNDFNGTNNGAGTPIGTLPTSATFNTAEFIGALCQTVKLIQTQCPNALIVICGNIGGRGDAGQIAGYQLRNSLGLTCADYAKAAKSVAEYMGIPYITTDECGINPFNRVSFITDSVHPNAAGAELISRPIIAYFETNQPN